MSTFEQKLFNALHPKRTAPRKRRRGGARRGRAVDEAYLAWMAQQPPLVGSGPVTVHHVRRFGEPKNDRRTVPLPAEYHMHDFGPNAIERIGKQKFQTLFGVDLEAAIVRYNERYEFETRRPFYEANPVDSRAPWQFSQSRVQREEPGRGRYRVIATFVSDAERCTVTFWLPAESGPDRHTLWLAYREIVNSGKDPATFEGLTLPTRGDA
jgi:hypothetical protein